MPRIDGSQSAQPQSHVEQNQNASGQLGARQVRADESGLPRLDRIKGTEPPKGNFLTRHFESVATKMDRTSRSVDAHTEKLLNTLDRPPGKALNGKALLNQLATLRNHYAQMSRLSGREIDPNTTLQLAVAGRLGGMDNEKLVNVYRSFLSEDLTALRSALEAETLRNPGNIAAKHSLEDLGIVEAMLVMEISGRVARGSGDDVQPLQDRLLQSQVPERTASSRMAWPVNEHAPLLDAQRSVRSDAAAQTGRMSDKSLEVLVESGARSANLHDRSLAGQANARLENKQFEMTAHQVGDAMRAADLTMNFNLADFLGIGRPTGAIDTCSSMRNMFQWGVKPQDNVGALKRDATERQFFESLENSPLDPDSRPTYGALNVGRFSTGGADSYGGCFFVLKPEVKQRCTFTVDDTFNVPQCKATPEGLARFDTALQGLLPKLSESAQSLLANQGNRNKLLASFETRGSFSTLDLENAIDQALGNTRQLSPDDLNSIALLVQQTLIDRDATHAQVAGYDNIENLLTHIGDKRLNLMMIGVESPSKGNIRIGNYIEAQVHGRVAFDRDIQALRVSEGDVKSLVNRYRKGLTEEAVRQKLADFCDRNGIELTYYDDSAPSIDQEMDEHETYEQDVFSIQHADRRVWKETSAALNTLLDASNTAPDGFSHLLASAGDLLQFDTTSLNAVNLGRLRENIAREVADMSDQGRHRVDASEVKQAAKEAIQAFIETKKALLSTVAGLNMPAGQTDMFKKFVLGSSTLNSPAMLTALHRSTGAGVALLQDLANISSLTEPRQIQEAMGALRDFVNECRAELDAASHGKPWGRDDLMLFTDRVLSLSASMFVMEGGEAAPLYERLVSPQAIELGDALQFDGRSVHMAENTRRNMADALHIMTLMVGREAGHSAPEVELALHHKFTMQDPSDLPEPIRQALTSLDLL